MEILQREKKGKRMNQDEVFYSKSTPCIMKVGDYDVLIDAEDAYKIQKMGPWRVSNCRGKLYVRNYKIVAGRQVQTMMHRIISNALEGAEVDHINGNTLDNRKENLRLCTHSENIKNQKLRSNNKSGYKGVYFCKNNQKWRSSIRVNGKKFYLGSFNNPEEAYASYCDASKKYHGEFGRTK
jgi:hypothetical protein